MCRESHPQASPTPAGSPRRRHQRPSMRRPRSGALAVLTVLCASNLQSCSNLPCQSDHGGALIGLIDGTCGQFGSGVYTLTDTGTTFRVILNGLLFPSEIFWGSSHAAFAWSLDGSEVTAIIDDGPTSEMHTYDLATSANARTLSSSPALPDAQAYAVKVRVLPMSGASTWGPLPDSEKQAGETAERSAKNQAKQITATFQNAPPFRDMPDYLNFLGRQALGHSSLAEDMMMRIAREGRAPTRLESLLIDALTRISNALTRIADHQEHACIPCTAQCGLGCYGACRTPAGGLTVCLVRRSSECLPPSTFILGAGCLSGDTGACCTRRFDVSRGCRPLGALPCTDEGGRFNLGLPCETALCTPMGACCIGNYECHAAFDRTECESIATSLGAAFFAFHEDITCPGLAAMDLCNHGVCCYPDGRYNCDFRTMEACQQVAGQGAYFIPGPCEAATCE